VCVCVWKHTLADLFSPNHNSPEYQQVVRSAAFHNVVNSSKFISSQNSFANPSIVSNRLYNRPFIMSGGIYGYASQ
jgi:hypothetical protein